MKSKRKEAIKLTLNDFVQRKLLERVDYGNCTTAHFKVSGANYLKIMEQFDKANTRAEENKRITTAELYDLLLPYFVELTDDRDKQPKPQKEESITEPEAPEWSKELVYEAMIKEYMPGLLQEAVFKRGISLSNKICELTKHITPENKDEMLHSIITPEVCQPLTLRGLIGHLDNHYDKDIITRVYITHTGLNNPEALKIAERGKYEYGHSEQHQEYNNPSPYQVSNPYYGNKQSLKEYHERCRELQEKRADSEARAQHSRMMAKRKAEEARGLDRLTELQTKD